MHTEHAGLCLPNVPRILSRTKVRTIPNRKQSVWRFGQYYVTRRSLLLQRMFAQIHKWTIACHHFDVPSQSKHPLLSSLDASVQLHSYPNVVPSKVGLHLYTGASSGSSKFSPNDVEHTVPGLAFCTSMALGGEAPSWQMRFLVSKRSGWQVATKWTSTNDKRLQYNKHALWCFQCLVSVYTYDTAIFCPLTSLPTLPCKKMKMEQRFLAILPLGSYTDPHVSTYVT